MVQSFFYFRHESWVSTKKDNPLLVSCSQIFIYTKLIFCPCKKDNSLIHSRFIQILSNSINTQTGRILFTSIHFQSIVYIYFFNLCIEEENVEFEDDQASNSKMLCINMVDHEKAMIYLHFVVWISIQCCLVGRDRSEQNDHIYQIILPVFLISYTQWMNL